MKENKKERKIRDVKMADVKTIVKQMKDAGMSYPDILSNLKELGIANAEEQLGKIAKELDGDEKPARKEPRHEREVKTERNEREKQSADEGETEDASPRRKGTEEKMDKIIALLKSLHELNSKILESNRDILTKLERRQSHNDGSSSSGKGGELF